MKEKRLRKIQRGWQIIDAKMLEMLHHCLTSSQVTVLASAAHHILPLKTTRMKRPENKTTSTLNSRAPSRLEQSCSFRVPIATIFTWDIIITTS